MSQRLAAASSALDIQTGGGEVLAEATSVPPTMAATEWYPPNLAKVTQLLGPRGVVVVADPDEPPLPFADAVFELVTSRHPATVWWREIARVLTPGGTYFAQYVGPATAFELVEYFLGPQHQARRKRHHDDESAAAKVAGLEIVDVRCERLLMEFFDIGAVAQCCRRHLRPDGCVLIERHAPGWFDTAADVEHFADGITYRLRDSALQHAGLQLRDILTDDGTWLRAIADPGRPRPVLSG